jgi:hypothetical protein
MDRVFFVFGALCGSSLVRKWMVYCHLWIRNLSTESVHRVSISSSNLVAFYRYSVLCNNFFFFFFFPQSLTPKRMIWMVDYQRRILTNSGKAFVSTCLPDCNFLFSVQTLRQKITRIQILAFLRTICDYFLLYDVLPNFRCPSLLANSVVIFYRSFLYHDETTDQTHD